MNTMIRNRLEGIERVVVPGLLGAGLSVLIAYLGATAIEAKSREYDMGGIPILFAMLGFVPFAGGALAGLVAPARAYWAAAAAWFLQGGVGLILNSQPGPDRPIETYLMPIPIWLLFALWGALLVDPHPARYQAFRDASLVGAAAMCLLAIIPIADVWLPGKSAWLLVVLVAAFFLWIARRNRVAS